MCKRKWKKYIRYTLLSVLLLGCNVNIAYAQGQTEYVQEQTMEYESENKENIRDNVQVEQQSVSQNEIENIIEVNGSEYTTLQDAMAQVESDGTIKLLSDIYEENVTIPTDKSFTVDLNGYILNTKNSIADSGTVEVYDNSNPDKSVVEVTDENNTFYQYKTDDVVTTEFKGGSLRMDYRTSTGQLYYSKTSLRFGYRIYVKDTSDIQITDWRWYYSTNTKKLGATVVGVNKTDFLDGFVSNLVVTDIPAKYYNTSIYARLRVTYTKKDDSSYYTILDKKEERSVIKVADLIMADSNSGSDELNYAKRIKKEYDDENQWTGYH